MLMIAVILAIPSRDAALRTPAPSVMSPPKVEPVVFADVTPADAKSINAKVPFSQDPLTAPLPTRMKLDTVNFDRARDCLALAAWYEAGDDSVGERSVVQVILNRAMHPAFPKTVCGVVFQGSERKTGCQFTFTCDGSLASRKPSALAWERARLIAKLALTGHIDSSVGLATHYHTDWVVPYWSSSLVKLAKVETHLFYKFRGFWGNLGALRHLQDTGEPVIPLMSGISPAHQSGGVGVAIIDGVEQRTDAELLAEQNRMKAAPTATSGRDGQPAPTAMLSELRGNRLATADRSKGRYGLIMDLERYPGSYVLVARSLCGTRDSCSVVGWRDVDAPNDAAALVDLRHKAVFRFSRQGGVERAEWDCRQFPAQAPSCVGKHAP